MEEDRLKYLEAKVKFARENGYDEMYRGYNILLNSYQTPQKRFTFSWIRSIINKLMGR